MMPVTFYVDDKDSPVLDDLYRYCQREEEMGQSKNMWLVKPG